ncbi:hypothetical protein K491DRAFT_99569 [Lophiostoma macrostomum CBS 122681]|uniref:NAP family protein n=1 Tax=Lophiostoma macrostomum CBS 122681 TaxID=1314788 RepID=A0A6A6SW93_9PLEO|nr:hypothetical protein K491DRAFT_99569 [Lophiostoma macrostomum CBS 122681]
MTEHNPEEVLARFEELSVLESEFEDAELELIRKSTALHAPLYKKRAALISKIPHFWALVFEQAPPEIDNFIQPSDSKLFAECLQTFDVTRFEIDDPKGSPRSFSFKFGFSDNQYFEDKVLEKKFWYRRSLDGWQGLVSEPVNIHWKKGQDLTDGLTSAAYKLHQAKQKLAEPANGDAKTKETDLPEYKALAAKIEESEETSNSFFAFFSYISSWKSVSAEESEKASKLEADRLEKKKRGEKVEDDEPVDEPEYDWQETEVFPSGDELATIIAEDIWPSAIKYYSHAHEADDEDLSDIDVEDMDEDEDDSDDEIDIRGLVGKGKAKASSDSPPPKKQRKA